MSNTVNFIVRVPRSLHLKLKERSKQLRISLNHLCQMILEKGDLSELDLAVESIKIAFKESLEGVVFFGSRARGQDHDNSDIDLLIVLNERVTRGDYKLIDLPEKYSPSLVTFPSKPSGLWFEVALDGVVLFDKSGKLNNFLRGVRSYILEGKVKRQTTHGQGYWI